MIPRFFPAVADDYPIRLFALEGTGDKMLPTGFGNFPKSLSSLPGQKTRGVYFELVQNVKVFGPSYRFTAVQTAQ